MRNKLPRICEECGSPFEARPHNVKRGRGRFCRWACAMAARRRWLDSPEHFWERVDTTGSGCWPWLAAIGGNGYGRFSLRDGKFGDAHRRAWELTRGPLPLGAWVLHTCDNRPCCRPSHLFIGSATTNVADMIRKGRMPRGQARAHAKLTTDQVRVIRDQLAAGREQRSLALEFGVSNATIGDIARRKKWRHVV